MSPAPELDPETSAATESPYRTDGFAALRSYAPIGDGRTVALVAEDGAIDWFPVPDLDSVPVFAALIDRPNGGRVDLTPTVPFRTERRYLPGTNVLETTFITESGRVRVTDALNIGFGGRLPWTELARRVEGLGGEVPMRWRVAPGTCLNSASPWARRTPHGRVLRAGALNLAVCLSDNVDARWTDQAASGTFTTAAHERRVIGLVASESEPLMLSSADDIDQGLDRTIELWCNWSGQFEYTGSWEEEVRRSVLMLKLLIFSPTGAIAAAATTSLPERFSGGKNWDYRFAWVRDTAYTLGALRRFGIREETHSAVTWLLRTVRRHGPEVGVFYRLDGSSPDPVTEYEAAGWRGIGPVVTGNRADGQLQLSIFADLFDTVRLYVDSGHVLDTETGHLLAGFADRACDAWRHRDSGMWELQRREHYTSSKLGCWQALRCAVYLAEIGQIPGDPHRWADEAERIRDWVQRRCWSEGLGSYEWYPGSGKLDTSILLHAGSGFDRGPRMSATIDALRRELGSGPLLFRFSGARDDEHEGAFVACGFWAISALHHVGRTDEARDLMKELVGLTNDVGVLPEMIGAEDGAFMGNLPQGLSHLAMIGAALDLQS
ncbi:glycoside hydrolase family 15 protein [Mycobacterium saskatchewanense]|uniref:glycoside hydrolase family 15 protein n=1 Tax=Mycobacterium saskatchewanense TaxID=220927 RepID=UPI000A15869D|nr:glycoside hydrolase family 15 protein [Mycobacterium saskatchewanense]